MVDFYRLKKGTFVPSKYHQIFSNINTHPYIWPDFWKPYRQIDLFRPTVYFRPKTISKVAIINTKSATIAFFSFPPFFLLALSFFLSFSFVGVILELIGFKKPAFWRLFNRMAADFVRLVFKKSPTHTYIHM